MSASATCAWSCRRALRSTWTPPSRPATSRCSDARTTASTLKWRRERVARTARARFGSTPTSGSETCWSRASAELIAADRLPARDPADGVVAGVCAGIARALEVDPTLVRLLFALLALAGGAGIVLYLAAALLMPDELVKRPGRVRFAAGMT